MTNVDICISDLEVSDQWKYEGRRSCAYEMSEESVALKVVQMKYEMKFIQDNVVGGLWVIC